MRTFAERRWVAVTVTVLVAIALVVLFAFYHLSMRVSAYPSGWLLLIAVLFLAAYNVRKKLTYPPLLKSSHWLQLHMYVGLLSIVLFLGHTGLRVPNGVFEGLLALLYVCTAASGLIGLAFSRLIPSRLTVRGEEVLFERIPLFRRKLRERAEALVVESVGESGRSTIADFYEERLGDYFSGPRYRWRHLAQSTRHLKRLLGDLASEQRYLDEEEGARAEQLAGLIETKDQLDCHQAMQGLLKAWLFVHIPLTYALLLFALVHLVLVHAFAGARA